MSSCLEEVVMLSISGNARVFVYGEPVSMHKSFEGLFALAEQVFEEPLTAGAYFVFLNRPSNRMKVLYCDADGLAIWYKRLERGSFLRQSVKQATMCRREFFMLLEGVVPKRLNRRYNMP